MRKRKETAITQKVKAEREPGQPGINIEIKQTGMIATAEKQLPIYQKMLRTLPPGPAKEKVRDLIRIFKKVLKENEKLQKKVDAKDGFIRQSNVIPDISMPTAYKRGLPGQLSLFSDTDTEGEIYNYTHGKRASYEGDEFTLNETKILYTLSSLMFVRSQNKLHIKNKDYLAGDGLKADFSVMLNVSIYDIAKEYNGGKSPSGAIQERVFETIKSLINKKITIVIPTTDPDKVRKIYGEPLLKMDAIENKKTGKIISGQVWLNPAFRAAIHNNYSDKPRFLHTKITEAIKETRGHNRATDTDWYLINFLGRWVNVGTRSADGTYSINESKLMEDIAPKEMADGKTSLAKQKAENAINVAKKLKLITDHKYENNTTGGKKHVFRLNKDWHKE